MLFSSVLFSKGIRSFLPVIRKMSSYTICEAGTACSEGYRAFLSGSNGPISLFHDIPLFADSQRTTMQMIVEIPRWSNAKMEICKEERLNPIKQDIKKGKLRNVANVFPFKGYIWNYGAFPQTWEDPEHKDPATDCNGDNDPLDVCEIGSKIHPIGSVISVKPLGILGLIDEGETDWKVIVIDVTDPLASKLNNITDVEDHMRGYLNATRDWFRIYKMPAGSPPNQFAFNGEFKDRDFAMKIINETHQQWQRLIGKDVENKGISCENVSVAGSPYLVNRDDAKIIVDSAGPFKPSDSQPDPANDVWHYVQA